jgi:dTDP-4-amino-4,6-dideoxygalactose transaminase
MGVFAFYPNKQITTAEGGMIVTNNQDFAEMMRALRNQGRAPGDTWLQHSYLGYNYRMDELSAALGRVQVGRLDELLEKRARVAGWYQERLSELPMVEIPEVAPTTTKMSWFVYVIRVAAGIDRDAVIHRLAEEGIPARPYFAPIHLQLYMMEMFGYQKGDYPVTEDLGDRGIAIPFSGVMTEEQVEIVCQALAKILRS